MIWYPTATGGIGQAQDAHILVISNRINSTVPIVAKVLKQAGAFDPRKVFGVPTLDVVRASTFLSSTAGTNPKDTKVTLVGGHSGVTTVPLFSQTPTASAVKPGEQYEPSCTVSSTVVMKSSR